VLKNTGAAVITNTVVTGGQNGATASTGANTGTTAVNYGMGPNGDGWHTVEIRFGNITGAGGFTSDATNHWGANSPSAITGFGSTGTGWTLNGGATVAADAATLTDGGGNEARSVFFNTQVPTAGSFTASFTYTAGGNKAADGFGFVLQTQAATAVGSGGGG